MRDELTQASRFDVPTPALPGRACWQLQLLKQPSSCSSAVRGVMLLAWLKSCCGPRARIQRAPLHELQPTWYVRAAMGRRPRGTACTSG